MGNRTLAILKPDSIAKRLTGSIITRINEAGFKIVAMKMLKLTNETAGGFYEMHQGKPFFEGLLEYMTSGPVIPIVLEKENAVDDFRKLIGATNPENAEIGTIRKSYADDITHNIVHGSDSDESAMREISYFFSAKEIVKNTWSYK